MPTILFVCTANICRSPVAEALFGAWLRQQALPEEWQVASAGTWAAPGLPASAFSREILGEMGLDLTSHRARRVDRATLQAAGLVVCMTRSQQEALQTEFPDLAGRVHLLSSMAGPAYDIADPYGGPREGYVEMVAELQHLIAAGGPRMLELARRTTAAP